MRRFLLGIFAGAYLVFGSLWVYDPQNSNQEAIGYLLLGLGLLAFVMSIRAPTGKERDIWKK